jgi:mRNA-degrading endonuclease RelE of RelBE toxin-antitoxin system
MTPWRIQWTPRAQRDLRHLDSQPAERVRRAIRRFASTGQGDVTRLTNSSELRLRVGDWRVRFELHPESHSMIVLHVLPRGRAYRD